MDYQNPHAPTDDSGANTPMDDDARSLNGDAQVTSHGIMALDGANDAPPATAAAQEDAPEVKAPSKSPAPVEPKTEAASDAVGAADEASNDEMQLDPPSAAPQTSAPAQEPTQETPAESTPAQTGTPPKSPAPAAEAAEVSATEAPAAIGTAPPTSTAGQDVEMSEEAAEKREEGLMERSAEDAQAEVDTELAGGGQTEGGPPVA